MAERSSRSRRPGSRGDAQTLEREHIQAIRLTTGSPASVDSILIDGELVFSQSRRTVTDEESPMDELPHLTR